MSYSGYDIEDALIMNQASLDRGFGRCSVFKKYVVPLKKYANGTSDVAFPPPEPPPERDGRRDTVRTSLHAQYKVIDQDGICAEGERLRNGDLLVNKHSPLNTQHDVDPFNMTIADFRRTPQVYKGPPHENTYVDKVLITGNRQIGDFIKIRVRSTRRPELGDKFSSRHGQKGVIGRIVPQEDMPFSDLGICPDIIMNPHGFPSRMTVGKMIELLAGKAGVLNGTFGDGTAFAGDTVDDCARQLINQCAPPPPCGSAGGLPP